VAAPRNQRRESERIAGKLALRGRGSKQAVAFLKKSSAKNF